MADTLYIQSAPYLKRHNNIKLFPYDLNCISRHFESLHKLLYQNLRKLNYEFEYFVKQLEVGDLLEFDRGTYGHWAVYFGMYEFEDEAIPCVVHRNNDDDISLAVLGSLSSLDSSRSFPVKHHIGMSCLQPLKDVICDSPVRINNSLDNDEPPRHEKEILHILHEEIIEVAKCGHSKTLYNLATNNCEHFAKFARNNKSESKQVQNVGKGLAIGAVASIAAIGLGMFLGSRETKSKQHSEDEQKEVEEVVEDDKPIKTEEPDEDEEEDDSDDDGFRITIDQNKIEEAKSSYSNASASFGVKNRNVGNINGVPAHELDIDSLDEKPWKKPGADITDYFNYGFTEETWQAYCNRQRKMRVGESGVGMPGINNTIVTNKSISTNPSFPLNQNNSIPTLGSNQVKPIVNRIPTTLNGSNNASQPSPLPPPQAPTTAAATTVPPVPSSIAVMTHDKREYSKKVISEIDFSVPPPGMTGIPTVGTTPNVNLPPPPIPHIPPGEFPQEDPFDYPSYSGGGYEPTMEAQWTAPPGDRDYDDRNNDWNRSSSRRSSRDERREYERKRRRSRSRSRDRYRDRDRRDRRRSRSKSPVYKHKKSKRKRRKGIKMTPRGSQKIALIKRKIHLFVFQKDVELLQFLTFDLLV
ncbi:FIP1L1 [Lepeophtheirus salmonis]|uniref:FIP1L1 n=1 Tax=Lepeophtheirus salmonis TaxID=72036 RepID=A0A7R8CE17_LEPSM|nr:FIP1L1 [Lepeophtheirus salmonis]CAF2781356.1 FIP1L1 [Lepeophtheirus salmonis]